jgi:biotin carboxyl carrier protein
VTTRAGAARPSKSAPLVLTVECALKNARDLVVKEVLVRRGDRVEADQLMIVVEMLKIVVEVRAPQAARVGRLFVREGREVQVGDRLVELEPLAA